MSHEDGRATVLVRAWEQRPSWLFPKNLTGITRIPQNPSHSSRGSTGIPFPQLFNQKSPRKPTDGTRIPQARRTESPRIPSFCSMSIEKNVRMNTGEISKDRVGFGELILQPVAFMHFVPKDLALFFAGAFAGAAAKSLTAPLDRIKLLMQVHGLQAVEEGGKKSIGFMEAIIKIGQDEGLKGYWKGNLPQVIRVIPYSAVQLFAYEVYKKLFKGGDGELSVIGRLAAGGCAGMTSTLVTYPLDVLRLRLAVDSASKTMSQVALAMLHEEGIGSFYKGLGPSLIGIAPYIAINFCVFDLIKKAMPENFRKRPQASFVTAIASATFATLLCYPLDTVRRQLQMKGSPFDTVFDAFPGIIERDGILGLYRGFVPNALKNLPNSSVRLTTFDAAKNLVHAGEVEYEKLLQKNKSKAED